MPYFLRYPDIIFKLTLQHLYLVLIALSIALIVALPLAWFLNRHKRLSNIVMGFFGIVYTIPSIALMIMLIPFLGLNEKSVIVALVLYSQVILLRNILTGLDGIPKATIEAANGMGLSTWQIAWKIQLPLALPVILAGVRISAVVVVAIATIGAKFGAGGLGTLLFDGIAQAGRTDKIWTGAIIVGLVAFSLSRLALYLEKRFSYPV
jgi:osmoprotectant transport system permease protein